MTKYDQLWAAIRATAIAKAKAFVDGFTPELMLIMDGNYVVSDVQESGPTVPLVSDEYSVSVDVFKVVGDRKLFALGLRIILRDGEDDGFPGAYGTLVELEGPNSRILGGGSLCTYVDDDAAVVSSINFDVAPAISEAIEAIQSPEMARELALAA